MPDLLSSLQSWSSACEDTLADLEAQIKAVKQEANARAQRTAAAEARLAKLVQQETDNPTPETGGGGRGGGAALSGRGQRLGGGGGGGGPGLRSQGFGARFGSKRGIGHMDAASGGGGAGGTVDDEAMDLDEDEEVDAKNKKNSKRKIQG